MNRGPYIHSTNIEPVSTNGDNDVPVYRCQRL